MISSSSSQIVAVSGWMADGKRLAITIDARPPSRFRLLLLLLFCSVLSPLASSVGDVRRDANLRSLSPPPPPFSLSFSLFYCCCCSFNDDDGDATDANCDFKAIAKSPRHLGTSSSSLSASLFLLLHFTTDIRTTTATATDADAEASHFLVYYQQRQQRQ